MRWAGCSGAVGMASLHGLQALRNCHMLSSSLPPPAELRTAYEGLAHENQRLQQSLGELTRELQARDTGGLEGCAGAECTAALLPCFHWAGT